MLMNVNLGWINNNQGVMNLLRSQLSSLKITTILVQAIILNYGFSDKMSLHAKHDKHWINISITYR